MASLLKNRVDSASKAPSPLPEKIAAILQESRWLALVVLAAFLGLSLWGYHRDDPGWSHAVHATTLHNPTGRGGAWLADLLLYVFGVSAWWWIVFLIAVVWWGYRRLGGLRSADRRPFFIALSGFIVLLASSTGLENLRFYSLKAQLPLDHGAGGVLGFEIGHLAVRYLGYTGATLTLLAALGLGWSIFSGMSWLSAAERFGALLEAACGAVRGLFERWQDRRIGREVAREREAVVDDEKRRFETQAPIIIEVPEPAIPVSAKVEKRIERERQVPLFPEAVVGGLLPPLHLLEPAELQTDRVSAESLEYTSRLIERKLADFGVQARVLAAYPGPVITRFEIEPAVGVKGAQIVNLAKDMARALSMVSIRVVETVPGKSCMALELPNAKRQIVRLSEIISSSAYHDMSSPLAMTLGKDIGGHPVVVDLAKMPHLLVAGTTGSGKSVGINAMILSLLYKSEPDKVRLILVDPKMLELSIYEGIPHLLAPVVVDMKQAANALNWCVAEMERRYKLMSAMGVRNIAGLNHRIKDGEKAGNKLTNPFSLTPEAPEPLVSMPNIVLVIDELADLMMVAGKKVEQLIARLAQKARASGIHLILATQRPSVDVITGLIKANIPTRMSFQVSSKIDSRTIIDQMGAEALLGQGDMLFLAPGTGYPTRVHGAFVADDEVHHVVDYLKRAGAPNYVEGVLTGAGLDDDGEEGGDNGEGNGAAVDGESDPLYDQAVQIVLKNRRASISLVQRHLRIGYNRSARLIEAMEKSGLVSAMDGRGGREVIARKPE
ncbi:MAG: DNA translocase FtsK 4TM domain-containing protein [Propionivibrio sp.]|uniref:DNA translocase FtsK n=1 Tax=Propionivibrio sp. TaxID=2212460 RepID=UPI0026013B3D|nr:DNA translocase FtsK [Propionivibrio sp.]MBL0208120.1 DNA translocase FtsK 4TM domain-containing protein [Propionivibrio sp.]